MDVRDVTKELKVGDRVIVTGPFSAPFFSRVLNVAGGLNMARKAGKGIRFYVEKPETFMHPEQQANITSALLAMMKDYGPPEVEPVVEVAP